MEENTQASVTTIALSLAKQAPHWFCLIAVVGGFLYYLDRKDHLAASHQHLIEEITVERIKQCHAVQEKASESMGQLNGTLIKWEATMDRQTDTMEEQTDTMRGLQAVIETSLRR